jgi:GAF domain-containing protein
MSKAVVRGVCGRHRPRTRSDVTLPVHALAGAVRGVGLALGADRCWLYARDPTIATGVALVRWLRAGDVADVPQDLRSWNVEAADLSRRDPLFARALAGAPADVIDDVETADVDLSLERALGHRAFVHLNLHANGSLWGVLQPGMTTRPRPWTSAERSALLDLRPALAPLVVAALRGGSGRPASCRAVG